MEIVKQLQWYAVRTRSRHEEKVRHRLCSKSFDIFYPQIEVWSRRKDRKKKVRKSLFPGYLFVNCIITKETWIEIVKTYGVVDILGYENQPTPISTEQITSIQTVANSDVPVKPHPYLNIGDRVIVVDGPLKGAIGIYMAHDYQKGKLIISVDLLNRSIEVEMESAYVEAF